MKNRLKKRLFYDEKTKSLSKIRFKNLANAGQGGQLVLMYFNLYSRGSLPKGFLHWHWKML